ncbi:hypothetical protein [Aeromicrobium fastidiosum]|uniref:Uncharacterized protein n=1 Tax=Aeromicrobium fastidiosum TaxID=52699 RepID=A0A641ASM1_9ACTN|nr:hypothetical protein [Aeromicrobium fastidiosum]KAA1380527.1 hypothetical protein ESP62_004945 [Aeromicrobium fastidiosum]MBP2390119.1 putative membrane protein [Aeromicrobium fastidiosum]
MRSVLAALVHGVDPIYRDVVTTGGLIVVALIGLVGTLAGLGYVRLGRKLDTAVVQTQPTGNGFAQEMRESLRQVHRRLDAQNEHTAKRDDHIDAVFIKFDDRLTHIEENLP